MTSLEREEDGPVENGREMEGERGRDRVATYMKKEKSA